MNGYASPFPSNRIVIYAHPPVSTAEFRNYDDWSRLVITHELAHIFHLDRADGVWGLGQRLFGRHPALFPNGYQPAWVIEGLAVYYESRVTGAGRLEGSEHYMIARAAAEAGRIPRVGELSRQTSRFPGGEVVYAYGGQIFDHIARTRGPGTIPRFVDVTSKVLLPLSLNRRAKRAFGISFENAWRDWRDSLVGAAAGSAGARDPFPQWRELTRDGRSVGFPRWLGDTAILYSAATGKEVTAAYTVSLNGEVERLGRRNGIDANAVMPDGSILFAQVDFTDAFHVRNDLYVERDGLQRRLTEGARLSNPDVSRTGEIIAVQSQPGTTRLVRVSADDGSIVPLTSGNSMIQWADPRWSPDGSSVAAVRITRGSGSEIVILNGDGALRGVAVAGSAVVAAPSWSRDGTHLYYTSTRSGTMQVYTRPIGATVSPQSGAPLSSASTGAFNPQRSPDGRSLAALSFTFDGYHVGVAPFPTTLPTSPARTARELCANCRLAVTVRNPVTEKDLGTPRNYSAIRSLVPSYWEPILAGSSSEVFLGAGTHGSDIIGRHAYAVQAIFNTRHRETEAFASYQYAGLGQPYLNFSVSQEHEHFDVFNSTGDDVGDLARRARIAGVSASVSRPRVRTAASFSLGADIESRSYATDPDTLLLRLSDVFGETRRYPSMFASAGWSNTKRPALSISREDGISVSASARQRWEAGEFADGSRSVIGVAAAFKSLHLPGFAHHVIAFRGAAGFADRRAISTFSAGGLSGGSLEVIAGVNIGDARRTFGVRGFPPSAQQGIRAYAGTAEYRLPLSAPSRRVRFVPILFDKISLSAFADAGRAWCPDRGEGICDTDRGGQVMASVGGEVNLDTALQYDYPVRLRLGSAFPFRGKEETSARSGSVYFTIGTSF